MYESIKASCMYSTYSAANFPGQKEKCELKLFSLTEKKLSYFSYRETSEIGTYTMS